ncbi:hypothetical protein SNEBB_010474 [Seison nebaliae]|nr:hypothetical protein SNEBB_010474 [Seison nebaliae]
MSSSTVNKCLSNDCSFYGNVAWDGYCSICFKLLQQPEETKKEKQKKLEINCQSMSSYDSMTSSLTSSTSSDSNSTSSNSSDISKSVHLPSFRSSVASSAAALSFKFLNSSFKQFTKYGSKRDDNNTTTTTTTKTTTTPTKNEILPNEFLVVKPSLEEDHNEIFRTYLQKLKKNHREWLQLTLQSFQKKLFLIEQNDYKTKVELLKSLRETLVKRLETTDILPKHKKEEEEEEFLENIEQWIMYEMYNRFFIQTKEDEDTDLYLQEKMRSMHWLTPQSLNAKIDLKVNKINFLIEQAISAITFLDAERTPKYKLKCIIDSVDYVMETLKLSINEVGVSADEFVPVIIYVMVKANPLMFHSNLEFIQRFLQQDLSTGQEGYFFTNILAAKHYIFNLNAKMLLKNTKNLDSEISDIGIREYASVNYRQMPSTKKHHQCQRLLNDLRLRRDQLTSLIDKLDTEMKDLTCEIKDTHENVENRFNHLQLPLPNEEHLDNEDKTNMMDNQMNENNNNNQIIPSRESSSELPIIPSSSITSTPTITPKHGRRLPNENLTALHQ